MWQYLDSQNIANESKCIGKNKELTARTTGGGGVDNTEKHDGYLPQSNTETKPWHYKEEPQNTNSHKTQQADNKATSSFPWQDDCKTQKSNQNDTSFG